MSTKLSTATATKILNISPQSVRTLCRDGSLDAIKFGNSWMISSESIHHYGLMSGHTIAEDHPAYASNKQKKPIALSFFSGAMGLDLGIEKAGFDIRLACEVDKHCRQTITLNRPDMALLSDINDCTANDVLKYANLTKSDNVDLII